MQPRNPSAESAKTFHPEADQPQSAPGDLERVRELLNTWVIPNDTRVTEDRFGIYVSCRDIAASEVKELRRFRDDLRWEVEHPGDALSPISRWVETLNLRPSVENGRLAWCHNGTLAGELLAIVFSAVAAGHWARLKSCPDCRWVFFDHSKNHSKKWCLMNAKSPSGRGCGTIAKVRRFRQRNALKSSEGDPN